MSDNLVTIEGLHRKEKGKSYCTKLRAKGRLPANILEGGKSISIEIDPKWLSKAWLGGKKFNLKLDGKARVVRIQELQINAVKRTPLHVDLMFE